MPRTFEYRMLIVDDDVVFREVADQYRKVWFNPLQFVIADDTGIAVMDYGQQGHWFQVLTPRIFKGVRLVNQK